MDINIPANALVVLAGPAGSGKSTFAATHFLPTQIVSSDHCRALVADDEADQSVSGEAFALLRTMVRLRLQLGRLTVVDSTAVERSHRRSLLRIGRAYSAPVIALLFDVGLKRCLEQNRLRSRRVPEDIIEEQDRAFRSSLASVASEGFDDTYLVREPFQTDIQVLAAWPKGRQSR